LKGLTAMNNHQKSLSKKLGQAQSQFVALTCRQLSPFVARSDAHSDGAGVN
jgi:hypothetical protein